jgi:hypothetical protein
MLALSRCSARSGRAARKAWALARTGAPSYRSRVSDIRLLNPIACSPAVVVDLPVCHERRRGDLTNSTPTASSFSQMTRHWTAKSSSGTSRSNSLPIHGGSEGRMVAPTSHIFNTVAGTAVRSLRTTLATLQRDRRPKFRLSIISISDYRSLVDQHTRYCLKFLDMRL